MTPAMKILWATKIGDPNWAEQLITENEAKIPDAIKWCELNGFDRIRIAEIDLNKKPNFISTLKTK